MKKLQAYKQSLIDLDFARETISAMLEKVHAIGNLTISSTVTLKVDSSDIQFIYAIGILNSQILACKELGIDTLSRIKTKEDCKDLRVLSKTLSDWREFRDELRNYNNEVFELLDEKERFSLLDYPTIK